MAKTLSSLIAQRTLDSIAASPAPGQPAFGGGDDPVSAIFQVAQERGIDPAHLLGLAKLETRAGEKTVKGDGTDTRNLFNVKDFSKAGNGIRARDNAEGSNDRYRQYASYRESAEDLVGLLERKYPAALKARSPEEFAQALKAGGYATDPLYERKLANTIRSSVGSLASVRPMQPTQEWDQGARYAPVGVTDKPKPAEKPKEGAGFWEGAADVGLAAAQGVVGSVKAITDLAGADNAVSRSLDDASKGIEKTKSDASQADRKYHQQKIREAEASGDWKDEVAAYANMVWDMPLESLAQGIGSFATLGAGKVAQMAKLASAAKKAGVTKEAFLKTAQGVEAAKQASNLGAKVNVGLGVGQGIGGVKGSQYEQTFNAAKESGLSDEQAQALATEAQSYQQGWGQQLVGAGLGYLAGKTGPIEKLASGQTVGAGGVARRFVGGGLVEAGTEGLQGGQERYAGNAAAIDAGVLDPSKQWAGVAGSGTSEAITAGILGGGAGALGRPDVDPQAQAKAAAQKSGGIVSRAGLAATPGAQQPAGQTGQAPAGSAAAAAGANEAPAQPTSVSAAPNPNFADMDDEGLKALGEFFTTRQTMTDGTPISDEDRKVGQEALAELARRQAAATASPAPAVGQNAIQASALSAIEQALQADQQRRRAAGEVVDDDVTDVEVKAPAQPAAKPPLSNEPDPMLPQAIDFLRQGGKPSVSAVQRQFRIGFNRAARLLEEMQRNGIVGPMDEQGARQILKLPDPPDGQANTPAQPAPSAGFSLPAFDNSPIPKLDPAEAADQRRVTAEFEQKRKNRRAATRASVWERNPFLGFLGANGINRDVANEFAPGLVEKRKAFVPGYGPVFRAGAKNLDELVQNAQEDGFLREDDDTPELYDLIERALRGERIAPLYADGAAEAEGQRRQRDVREREGATFEDYLQQAEGDDFDPFPLMADSGYDAQDLAGTDFDQADDAVRAEVAALAAQYGDLGFDPADVLETLAIETENQPEQNYYERARTRLSDLISQAYAQAQPGSNRAVRADRAEPLPAGAAGARGPAAGQQVAPAAPTPKLRNVDELAAEGFNRVVKQGDKTYFVNPDTRESVELDSPAQIARARARVQAKQRLGNLRGTRPQDFALDAVTPEALKARDEQAQAAQAQQTAEQQAAAAQAKADDERKRIEQASYAAADSFELGQNPLDSLTGQQDIFGAASPVAADLAGEKINDEWTAFDPQSGTLGIPRAQMPQIKAEHRGAMVNFLKARGIDGQQETIPSAAIKPTQAEFSPAKVKQAIDYTGGNRSIIVSADGYVVDGHHQWLAAREKGEPIPAIRLDQNIGDVLAALKDMPSAQPDSASTLTPEQIAAQAQALLPTVRRYASGLTAIGDLAPGARASGGAQLRGVGVDVGLLSKNAIEVLGNAVVNQKAAVFVDSGAFSAFRRGLKSGEFEPLDFNAILARYDAILDSVGRYAEQDGEQTSYPRPLLVMPDVVGSQADSLALIREHRNWIAAEVQGNLSQPIIPIQKGEMSMAEAYRQVVQLVGSDDFIVGIPSNEEAVTPDELRQFLADAKPRAIHILGAASDAKLQPRLESVVAAGLAGKVQVTADASPIRNKVIRAVAKGAKRGEVIESLLYDKNDPGYAQPEQGSKAEPVAGLFDGKPDPRNSAPLQELDGFKVGDAVDVPNRTIGRSRIETLFKRNTVGNAMSVARIVNADGKKLDVLTSMLVKVEANSDTYEQRNADRIARAKAADKQEAWDAITAEENADPERHFEGTDALRRAINARRLDLKPDTGSFAIYPDRQEAAKPSEEDSQYPLVTHTTAKGKVLRGYIVRGMTLDEVKASIDPYALKKDGGVFVREQHKDKLPKPAASSGSRGPSASQAWKNEGKSPADLIAEKAQSAGRELAVQVSEESREQDFRPSEIPQAVEQWAADASVPADDLKRILLQELPSLGVSNARIQQIRAALYPVLKPAASEKPAAAPAQQSDQASGFDSAAFDKARNDIIQASRDAGNTHLDQVPAYVETMRGKAIFYVHDPKVRGVIRTVDNSQNVYIDWSDAYSAEKEMVSPTQDGKKTVYRSTIGPRDLKDYALAPDKREQSGQQDRAQSALDQSIAAADVAAAEKQAAQMIEARIDGMKAADVQRIAARFLPTVGIKVPMGKAKIKEAMTDASAMNLLGPAGELGIELSESVKRALVAKMEGRVGDEQAAEQPDLDAQLAQVNDELAAQGMVQNANTRQKRDQLRTAIAERDFPEILKAVDGSIDAAEALHQAFQFSGNEPKAQTIERVLKHRGIAEEYRRRWAERLLAESKPAGREGYDTPVELDAAQLKAILEQTRGEPLVDKPAKLEAWRNGTAKTDPAKFPIELFLTTDGRLDVNDGRHRIALAAERGEKVTAFIDGKDAQRAKDLLSAVDDTGTGPFGPILTQYRGNAQGAIKALTELQDGEAVAALNHPDVGDIDLVWGKAPEGKSEGFGLAKLVAKHQEVLGDLQGFISRLIKDDKRSGANRIRLVDPKGEAVVSLDWKGDRKVWLLTAYEKGVEAGTTMDTASNGSKGDTARLGPDAESSLSQSGQDAQAVKSLDATLEAIFDQLDGLTQRTQANGQRAAAAHPQAERIQFVQKHILDILQDLEDTGKVSINC